MKNMIEANLSSSEQPGTNKPVPMKKTTMSVPEMRELLGLKKQRVTGWCTVAFLKQKSSVVRCVWIWKVLKSGTEIR